jgi:hypothetical protein
MTTSGPNTDKARSSFQLTVESSIVGLDVGGSDLAIHHLERIPLAPHASEDGRTVEVELESLGEGSRGISQEPNLRGPEGLAIGQSIARS